MSAQRRLTALLMGLLLGGASRAWAQQAPRTDRDFSPQTFHPAVGPDEFLTVEPAQPLGHLNFAVKVWGNYARAPLTIFQVDGATQQVGNSRARIVRDLGAADVTFALGISSRFQIGVGLPLAVYQTGDTFNYTYNGTSQTVTGASGFALGDPWVDVKLRLFGKERGFNLAVGGEATFPVANRATPDNFGGDRSFGAGGRLLAGVEAERWRLGVQVGYHWRAQTAQFFSSTVGSELRYAGAFAVDVAKRRRFAIIVEVAGHTGLSGSRLSNIDGGVLEVDLAGKLRLGRFVFLNFGVGTGILRGIGTPLARGILGVSITPDRRDRDKDGVLDFDDRCPDQPEDKDNFQDSDGCPDPDNDKDAIPDTQDRCPNEAEDFDEFEDQDGCPEPDNDKDGILDRDDACPLDKEDGKPPQPMDGCPADKVDSDNDGIPDVRDKCPGEPEDKDGFQDEDGCPDPDNDQDGYADGQDKCPDQAEDFDQFEDEDGCPDPDNDHDGVDDANDKCPNEPETINGVRDEDGCPDRGPPPKVELVGDEFVLIEQIGFDGRAKIQSRSLNLMNQLAATLRAHSDLKKVRIEGHCDPQGSAAESQKLSQERADAVRDYLVSKGVAAERLEAVGLGDTRPVSDNNSSRGREANRRIEFHVVKREAPAAQPSQEAPAQPNEETPGQ